MSIKLTWTSVAVIFAAISALVTIGRTLQTVNDLDRRVQALESAAIYYHGSAAPK